MNQPQHILAATDLSAPARHAVERAALVCKDMAAALELLHVANLAPLERLRQFMGTTPADMEQRVLDVARQKTSDLAAALEQRFGVAVGVHVATGYLLAELARNIEGLVASLLVCGARGGKRHSPLHAWHNGTARTEYVDLPRPRGEAAAPRILPADSPSSRLLRLVVTCHPTSTSHRAPSQDRITACL